MRNEASEGVGDGVGDGRQAIDGGGSMEVRPGSKWGRSASV